MNKTRFLALMLFYFSYPILLINGFCVPSTVFSSSSAVEPGWNIKMVNADQFWNSTNYRGENVIVAIIDSGVNYTLPDLDDNYLGGYDFVNDDEDPMDDYINPDTGRYGHGTQVASIAVGEGDDKIIGVAPRAKYFALKVADHTGNWMYADLRDAIQWAINHSADVICMSLGKPFFDEDTQINCTNAYRGGVVLVAASGNYGEGYPRYPAAYGGVIAVGACDEEGNILEQSNAGAELIAPGWNVPALDRYGNKDNFSITSAACPHVAGAAALTLSRYGKFGEINSTKRWCADETRQVLQSSSTQIGGCGQRLLNCQNMTGHRAFLKNAGFEYDRGVYPGLMYWDWESYGDCSPERSVILNNYYDSGWSIICDSGDCNCHMKLTTHTAGQDEVYMRNIYYREDFTIQSMERGKATRKLYAALEFPSISVGCQKARASIVIEFNKTTTENKWIYYSWYTSGSETDTNTTTTAYYNQGIASEYEYPVPNRDIRQDFYDAFGFQLNDQWFINSIWIEIYFGQTSSSDYMEVLLGEIRLYGRFTPPEDINNDEIVDIKDTVAAANACFSYPGHTKWDPRCDIAPPPGDLFVDIRDIVRIALHYGDC